MESDLGVLAILLCSTSVYTAVTNCLYSKEDLSNNVFSSTKAIQNSCVLLACSGMLIFWYELYFLIFYYVIAAGISLFFPYLKKPSKYVLYCANGICERFWGDKLIWTSLVYLLGAFAGLYHSQYELAVVSAITALGSVLYHRHREGQFFNFDNIFATSHVMMFGYAIIDAWENNPSFFTFSLVAAPIAVFLLVYCGDPAEVSKTTVPIIRNSRQLYDDYHTLWHLASGFGPVLVSFYFEGHDLSRLIQASVAISCFMNITANLCAVVPFD